MVNTYRKVINRFISVLIIVSMSLALLCGCDKEEVVRIVPAEYGSYGADIARTLATTYPYRKAYSEQEKEAGIMLKEEFETLGYEVEDQEFSTENGSSHNYIVKVEGKGFISVEGEEPTDIRKTVVIGAHYDSVYSEDEITEEYTYDGIDDNASGVAVVMTSAARIRNYTNLGFDVVFVLFGAGHDEYAGAKAFYNSLSIQDKLSIEVMYCIDSIYAGDKIYANAGYNSLNLSRKYEMRRKLYQAYDVSYENSLNSTYGFNLLYNESGVETDLDMNGYADIYREVSANKSDYVVFDDANIPVVFFDSFDYNFKTIEEMKQTKNLNLQDFDGMIRGTLLDSSEVLDPIYVTDDGDLLETRVNCIAFIILETMTKGSDYGFTAEQYDQYLEEQRLAAQTEASESTEE